MTVPLVILAAFSLFSGILEPGFGLVYQPMEHWLEPVFKAATEGAVILRDGHEHLIGPLALGGISAFAAGSGIAWWMYLARKGQPARRLAAALPGLHRFLLDKWRVDEFYDATALAMVDSLAETSAFVDKTIVDGVFARLTSLLVAASGTVLRATQTGVVHAYAAMMAVGLAAVAWFLAVPHASATVVDAGHDDYVVTAAPGVGYGYRWDADADGKPDKPLFEDEATLKVHVEPGKSQVVNLEVRNAFGLVKTTAIKVARPPAPLSSL